MPGGRGRDRARVGQIHCCNGRIDAHLVDRERFPLARGDDDVRITRRLVS